MDQELTDAAAYAPSIRYMCTYQIATLLCEMKLWLLSWNHDVISESRLSIDAYLL